MCTAVCFAWLCVCVQVCLCEQLRVCAYEHACVCVCVCHASHLLLGDADVAQVRFVRLSGEHPAAAEALAEDRLQEEVRLL